MRLQSAPSYCGPAAVVNACRAMGLKLKEKWVAENAGTTSKGTQEHGLKQAISRAGCTFDEINVRKYKDAESRLLAHLKKHPAVVLTEAGDHWVAAIGLLGGSVVIFNSDTDAANKRENGVHVIKSGDQLRRYWAPCDGYRYALLIFPPA